MGRELVPRVPSPKLIPKGDGDVGPKSPARRPLRICTLRDRMLNSAARVLLHPFIDATSMRCAVYASYIIYIGRPPIYIVVLIKFICTVAGSGTRALSRVKRLPTPF